MSGLAFPCANDRPEVTLAWFDVAVNHIDAFDQQFVAFVIDRNDFASNRFVAATNDLDGVAGMNFH